MTTAHVRALVVDDEPLARSALHALIVERAELDWIGEAADGVVALAQIESLKPELIFLDINLPGMSGIDVLSQVDAPPVVVFTTAHDEYALTAFELGAIDYLLKPFGRERFARAVERALPQVESARASTRTEAGAGQAEVPLEVRMRFARDVERLRHELFVRDRGKVISIRLADISRFESDGDYVAVHARGRRFLLYVNLGELADRLDPASFLRVHRSHIVNLSFLKSVSPIDPDRVALQLHDGASVSASRSGTRALRRWMRSSRTGE